MGRKPKRDRWFVGGPLVFMVGALIGSCDGAATEQETRGQGAQRDATSGSGGSSLLVTDASSGEFYPINADPYDAGDVGPQPLIECGDGGDGDSKSSDASGDEIDECVPPPSRCVDTRGLLYYQNGRCVEGRCVWDQTVYRCLCRNDGCLDNVTLAAPN